MSADVYDGHGRHTASLDQYLKENRIAPRRVETRAQFARSEALRHFFGAKSASDFYFQDILNTFIALAQFPLNFAIFRENGSGDIQELVHFCTDKDYEDRFRDALSELQIITDDRKTQTVFRLFPDLLQKHHIAIFHIDQADFTFKPVRAHMSAFPALAQEDEGFDVAKCSISNLEEYIASCADYFFQFMWDAFTSQFAEVASEYLEVSLKRLADNSQDWEGQNNHLRQTLEQISTQKNLAIPGGSRGREIWKSWLENSFSRVLAHAASGINLISSMMKPLESDELNATDELFSSPNILVAFRTFSRPVNAPRHQVNERGYLYDTSFLIPEQLRNDFIRTLSNLRSFGRKERLNKNWKNFARKFEGEDGKRRLYSNVIDTGGQSFADPETLKVIDREFWKLLDQENGPEKCVEILESWVGSGTKSFVDPVYQTGLVQLTQLFRSGGLERVADLEQVRLRKFESLGTQDQQDVRRLVIFYYVLGEIVGWAPTGFRFDPNNLAVVLIPIKMRGSIWGVTIHGVYTPDYDTIYADERFWQAFFKLATDNRSKNKQVFDRYLWGLAEQHVEHLVYKHFLKTDRARPDLMDVLARINRSLRRTETFSPFGFPNLHLSLVEPKGENSIPILPDASNTAWITWDIQDNRLFRAHQQWDMKSSRTLTFVVNHGRWRAHDQIVSGKKALNTLYRRSHSR